MATTAQHFRQAPPPAGCERSSAESVTTTCSAAAPSPRLHERLAVQAGGRLQQSLTTLVDNALLYTGGPVILTASSSPARELVLHVRDRSPGVLPSEREAIFGRFVRGSAGLASPHPGGGADFQLLLAGVRAGAGEATRENTEAVGGGTDVLC